MIDQPSLSQIPGMKQLWKAVFGDDEAFISLFFEKAYNPDRCLCALDGSKVKGMVHWLPCTVQGKRYAYLYALAVAPECRCQGVARKLLNAAHHLLELEDWAGVILMPQQPDLEEMYQKFGYTPACTYNEGIASMGTDSAVMHRITAGEYAQLRGKYLPAEGATQEEPFLSLLEGDLKFYRGPDFLLAAREEPDHLFGLELLGNTLAAPGILASLGIPWGRFRTPGPKQRGAMWKLLAPDAPKPGYLAFDLS